MEQPLNIFVSGVDDRLQGILQKMNCQHWAINFMYKQKYIEAFEDKEKLVYLTADSENLIDVLDPNMTYIVGGIVDHNRYKLLTYKKALE